MQPVAKHKTPIWVWILVAVVAVFLLAAIALGVGGFLLIKNVTQDPASIVKILAAANPDLEVLETDTKRGVLKVRDKKQNKVLTIDLNEAKLGRISVVGEAGERIDINSEGDGKVVARTREGTMVLGGAQDVKLPAWFPAAEGCKFEQNMSVTGGETEAFSGRMRCQDLPKAVDFYLNFLKKDGFKINDMNMNSDGKATRLITGSKDQFQATITVDPANEGFAYLVLASPGFK